MADNTPIEWTDATWNPVTGCSVVSPGCTNCYAMRLAGSRMKHQRSREGLTDDSRAGPVWNGRVRFNEEWLDQPLLWRKPRRIFVCAHGDLFHENVPDDWIDRVFAVMALCPQHQFQVLTKRSARMREYVTATNPAPDGPGMQDRLWHIHYAIRALSPDVNRHVKTWPLPNVWLGVSVEDQRRADERIPHLLATPAAVRFVSAEPLLGPVDLTELDTGSGWVDALQSYIKYPTLTEGVFRHEPIDWPRLDWVITGGESGPGARPMHPQWARDIRDQCRATGVAFFFKQWGEWGPCDHLGDAVDGWAFGCFDDAGRWVHPVDQDWASRGRTILFRAGKRDAGRLLDGCEWNEVPG